MRHLPSKMAFFFMCQFIGVAHACMPIFLDTFPLEQQQSKSSSSNTNKSENVPKPLVKSVEVGRASKDAPCPDVASITVELELPQGAKIDLKNLGFELSIVSGSKPQSLPIPVEPVSLSIVHSARTGALIIGWLEDSRKELKPINLLFKINAVTAQGVRSASNEFKVASPQ